MFKLKAIANGLGLAAMLAAGAVAHAATQPIYSQNFDGVSQGSLAGSIGASGMVDLNRSTTPKNQWGGGNSDVFTAQSGTTGSYFANTYDSGGLSGSISDWLITPTVTLTNTMTFSFWARESADVGTFADSLQFGVCTGAVCTAIAAASTTTNAALLALFGPAKVSINPTFDPNGFPTQWTNYTGTITGLSGQGRFAFRYFVDDVTVHGNYIGLDSISIAAVPEPESALLMALGFAAMGLTLRRKARK